MHACSFALPSHETSRTSATVSWGAAAQNPSDPQKSTSLQLGACREEQPAVSVPRSAWPRVLADSRVSDYCRASNSPPKEEGPL